MQLLSIQFIRAIAALSVVLFHSHFAVASFDDAYKVTLPFVYQWGYLGVDLFFVVSGFIIAHIASRSHFQFVPFLIRRFFRIYPIYWLFTCAAVYLYFAYYYNLGGADFTASGILSAFAIFPLEPHPPYAVGWSLEHEIMFYALAAVVLSLSNLRALAIVLSVLGAVGLVWSVLLAGGTVNKVWDYHLFSVSNIHFLAGVLVYLNRDRLLRLRVMRPLIGCVGALWLFTTSIGALGVFSTAAATVCVAFASASLVVAMLNAEMLYSDWNGGALWSNPLAKFVVLIGNASFSLYLIHWGIEIELGRMKWKAIFGLPEWSAELFRFGVIGLAVLVAIAMYAKVEAPLIALGHRIASRFDRLNVVATGTKVSG